MTRPYKVRRIQIRDDGVFVESCPIFKEKCTLMHCFRCYHKERYLSGNVKLWCAYE